MILIVTGVPRAASTWLEAIFLAVREHCDLGWAARGLEAFAADRDACGLKDNHIYTGIFTTWEKLKIEKVKHPYRILHVRRDPRDLLVSTYFALKLSHSPGPSVDRHREDLRKISEEEGLLHMTNETRNSINIMTSFHGKGSEDHCYSVDFAELTQNPYPHLRAYLLSAGVKLSMLRLRQLLWQRTFKHLSGGRKPGQEDVGHHFRKGIVGDWKNRFTPAIKEKFKKLYGQDLIKLGYEKDLSW